MTPPTDPPRAAGRETACPKGCIYSRSMHQPYPRLCVRCRTPEPARDVPAGSREAGAGEVETDDTGTTLAHVEKYLRLGRRSIGGDFHMADEVGRVRAQLAALRPPAGVRETERDACKFCLGAKGGIRGNENVVRGVTVCDHCTSLLMDMGVSLRPAAAVCETDHSAREAARVIECGRWLAQDLGTSEPERAGIVWELVALARQASLPPAGRREAEDTGYPDTVRLDAVIGWGMLTAAPHRTGFMSGGDYRAKIDAELESEAESRASAPVAADAREKSDA